MNSHNADTEVRTLHIHTHSKGVNINSICSTVHRHIAEDNRRDGGTYILPMTAFLGFLGRK